MSASEFLCGFRLFLLLAEFENVRIAVAIEMPTVARTEVVGLLQNLPIGLKHVQPSKWGLLFPSWCQ